MTVRRLDPNQPENFEFTPENLVWVQELIKKYPEGKQRSAVIPMLWRAQEQNDGWLSEPAIRNVAEMLGMAYIRVLEVATFYTMFQLSPVGKKAHVQVCGTTPCMLRGSEALIEICKKRIAAQPHQLSEDGNFSWEEVECLGACVNAPMVQIWKDTYEDLDPEAFEALLDAFDKGDSPQPGPQIKRQYSAPESGPTTLTDVPPYQPQQTNGAASPKIEGTELSQSSHFVSATNIDSESQNDNEDKSDLATSPSPKIINVASEDERSSMRKGSDHDEEPAEEGITDEAPTDEAPTGEGPTSEGPTDEGHSVGESVEGFRPEGMAAPREGKADDLKQIKGVGPKLEGILNDLGFYHFDQIAKWSDDNIAWVDEHLSFKGRIEREEWLPQAKLLAAGGTTEFSERVEKGEVASSLSSEQDKGDE